MAFLLRLLSPEDYGKGFLETLENLVPVGLTVAEAQIIGERRTQAGVITLVAEIEGKVVGTASLIIEQKFIHRGGRIGHIEDVAVHRDANGKGIGSALIQELLRLAWWQSCYKVILNCHEHLTPFYAKQGFRKHDYGMRIDVPSPK